MHAKLKEPLDTIAVLDKIKKNAEILDVDCIYLEDLQIFRSRKVAVISMRIGACDSNGCHRPSHEHDAKIARMNVEEPLFSELFLDKSGNLKTNIPEEVFEKLFEQGIKGGNQLVWGFDKEKTEIQLEGCKVPKLISLK